MEKYFLNLQLSSLANVHPVFELSYLMAPGQWRWVSFNVETFLELNLSSVDIDVRF